MKLFDFAYISALDDRVKHLAENLADEDSWDFSDTRVKKYSILKNYLNYTFKKVYEDKQVAFTTDNEFACFNTGLITSHYEDIYGLFTKYKGRNKKQEYFFKGFFKESETKLLNHFSSNLPKKADYFKNPADMILNPKFEIIASVEHIVDDNLDRFPDNIKSLGKNSQCSILKGAIDIAKKRVVANYKLAVPQHYDGRIQLLLPLLLSDHQSNPDLALALEKHDSFYSARTCLTIKMAYNNARLITKPQSSWLVP